MPSGVKATGTPAASRWLPSQPLTEYTVVNAMPATAVGSANGRSTSASMIRRPGSGCRTSSHASSTPNTMLMAAAAAEAPIVRRYAASARGAVTTCHHSLQLSEAALTNRPLSGMRTSSDRYSTVSPSVGPKPGNVRRRARV